MLATAYRFREVGQTWSFRGSKSRNKVTVGEPAVGSLQKIYTLERGDSFPLALSYPLFESNAQADEEKNTNIL